MSGPTEPVEKSQPAGDFAREAQKPQPSFMAEVWSLLRHNRKWWLLPVIIVLFLVGLLGILGGTALAPFIYTLF